MVHTTHKKTLDELYKTVDRKDVEATLDYDGYRAEIYNYIQSLGYC